MQLKIVSTKTIRIIVFVGVILFLPFFLYPFQKGFNLFSGWVGSELPLLPTHIVLKLPLLNQGELVLLADGPVRLLIPTIGVDAVIEHVGVTPQGTMGVPDGPINVAWYDLGPHPGEVGSAVIAGHYGTWKSGEGSVFDNLHKLKKGDRVYVKDNKGVVSSFVVQESRSYDPHGDSSVVFGSNDGKSHLNLITCEGVWDEVTESYSLRLVVFTDKE